MPRSMFSSSFSPRVAPAAFLGLAGDPLTPRESAQKAAIEKICEIADEWSKASTDADKSAWKKSYQQAATAYVNKFHGGEAPTDIISEFHQWCPSPRLKDLIPADWIRKWEQRWRALPPVPPRTQTPTSSVTPRPQTATPRATPTSQMTPFAPRTPVSTPSRPIDIPQSAFEPTPTAALQPASIPTSQAITSSSFQESVATGCPPNQFPIDPMHPEKGCRGAVSMPNLPGGFPMGPSASVAPMQLSPTSMPATSFMGRRVALRGVHSPGNIEWWMYQQGFIPELYFARPRVRRATLGVGKPVPPGICCQATDDGGAICSTGQGFPPTCPNKPEPNVPGVAEYIQQEGYLVPKPPPAPVNGVCGAAAPVQGAPAKDEGGGGLAPVVGLAAVGALVYAVVEGLL